MEPKKEHAEDEENGTNVERNTYDDPDTKTHAEEIKIETTTDETENNGSARDRPTGKRGGDANQIALRLPEKRFSKSYFCR